MPTVDAEVGLDLTGDVTLQAANDLHLGFALELSAFDGARVRGSKLMRLNTMRHSAWFA
jgi:hypothetical protein